MSGGIALECFSDSYAIARNRFRGIALNLGARLASFPIDRKDDNDEALIIDFALIGAKAPKWLVIISSGLHGVEGFFGSAVQFAFLQKALNNGNFHLDSGGGVLLIHAINPYGFAMLRRANEDNIDLNRNFLQQNEEYRGSPLRYSLINDFLNPKSPSQLLDLFLLKALWKVFRYGFPALRQAIAEGQYELPEGLFFGGGSPAKSTQIIQSNLPQWADSASQIIHLDFHTGLGKWATYKLFPLVLADPERYAWVFKQLGSDSVVNGAPYQSQGLMGKWLARKFVQKNYIYLNAEFGTYPQLKMLASLRAENRAHFYGNSDSRVYKKTKVQLLEAFCPKACGWRQSVLIDGLTLIKRALEACSKMHIYV